MSTNLPVIPIGTEKNVKLLLDTLAGRMDINKKALTINDLVNMGIISADGAKILQQLPPSFGQDDIIFPEVPVAPLPDLPTVPVSLGTTSSWGAIFLDWDYAAYNNEGGTEIWRSVVNDRTTANLIKLATGRSYADLVGAQAISYFYWLRNRSANNTVSGYNQLEGVQGSSNLKTTVQDFVMVHPEAEFVPFSIEQFGVDENDEPIWKILMNADVLIKGDLAIGQLISGEMSEGVEFSIGRGSIVMSTDTGTGAALGSILVTGDGGIAENDYLRIGNSAIISKVWDEESGTHVDYKELRRVERGQAQNGVQVKIPAYFKKEPTVYLSPEEVTTYSGAHSGQDQRLIIKTGSILPPAPPLPFDGSWYFTPTAILTLSTGVDTQAEPFTQSGPSDTATYESLHTFLTTIGMSATFTVSSRKKLANTNFKNRLIDITIDGSLNGGAYSEIGSGSVIVTGDGTTAQITISVSPLTSGTWKFRYNFEASDSDGETSSGGDEFELQDDTGTNGALISLITEPNVPVKSGLVQQYRPVRSADWDLYAVDYSYEYTWSIDAWCVIVGSGTFPDKEGGFGSITIPGVTDDMGARGSCSSFSGDFCNCNEYPYQDSTIRSVSGSGTGGTDGKVTITENDPLFLDGKYTSSEVFANGDNNPSSCLPNTFKGTARAQFEVTAYNVTYYYRKRITQDLTVTNYFQVNTVSADLGASDISVGLTTINWLATGE